MTQVYLTHAIHLLIGILHVSDLINKPRIAVGIRILQRHSLSALQRENDVLRIEHIEHGEDTIAIHLRHITAGECDSLRESLHLR